ncbi:MAG: hypothetical protein R6X20_06835 [Phycisphaerae bacterium]
MKLGKILLAIGLVSTVWALVGMPAAAEAAEKSAADLLAEAAKLYEAHNYEGALKRLQKIDRAGLGFFDKGKYDTLLEDTQKAVIGKAADEKAFAEGKEALSEKQYATAIRKLSQAAESPYLEADKAGPAKGLLRLARDGHAKALQQARDLIDQAAADLKAGQTDAARPKIDQVRSMDVQLAADDRAALANLQQRLTVARAEAPSETKPAEEKPAAQKPAEKPAAAEEPPPEKTPAEKPEPGKPAGSTPDDRYAKAKELYQAGQYAEAKKALARISPDELGFFQRLGYGSFVNDVDAAIAGRAAGEKALAQGKAALNEKKYRQAVDHLARAASCDYLPPAEQQEARQAHRQARQAHTQAVAEAKDLMQRARAALDENDPAQAGKLVDEVAAMDVDLGWWTGASFERLQRKVASAKTVQMAEAEPSAAAEAEKKPAEAEKPAEPEKKPAAPEKKPAEKPAEKPAAKEEAPVGIAAQARRAHAEEQIKLGREALGEHEYQKARIHFARAQDLWPASTQARAGLDEAKKLLAEREEPLGDLVRDLNSLERQRIVANVQEMLDEAVRKMEEAERPEDYTQALRPLAKADRTIDVAPALTVEEQERLREEVHALRKQIVERRARVEDVRSRRAAEEAEQREQARRQADRRDREQKIGQLWQRAEELRKSMQFGEAIQVLDRLLAVDATDERARRWREDMLYLESQERQVNVRSHREARTVEALTDVERAATHPGEEVNGEINYLRYPDAKSWKDLTVFRRAFTKAVSAEPTAVSETRNRLQEQIDLDFEKTSLDNVLNYISEVQRGLNIVIDPDISTAGIDMSTRVVDLKVKQVSVESVLQLILGADLGYRVESGYILVTTREKLQQNLPVVTYPVQDLVATIPDFGQEAPRFEVGDVTQAAAQAASGGGGAFGDLFGAGGDLGAEEGPAGPQELRDLIQRTVNNQSDPNVAAWGDEGGPAAIEYMNGLLIVTQTRIGHDKVSGLLEQLRRERAIMISVESRFCQVTDEFLQDITLDVDVAFLNAPGGGPVHWSAAGREIQNPGDIPGGAGYRTLPTARNQPVRQFYEDLDGDGVLDPVTDINGNPIGQVLTDPNLVSQTGGAYGQPIVLANTGSNNQGTSTLLNLAATAFSNFGPNEGGLAVSGVFLDDIQLGFLLRAIQADVRSTTLQAPRITLYNGQRAYISVSAVNTYIADMEPVVAEAAVGWDPTVGAVPVGVTLDVKATVSADRRYVQMDLRPQVAALDNLRAVPVQAAVPAGVATTNIELPEVSVQDFKTTVSVPDGGTLLLGGTRIYEEQEVETGVPILSKVPILKRVFNNRASVRRAENLLIMIRPQIIIQAEQEAKLGYDNF